MVTNINAYSVSLGLDASEYIRNSALSRSETRLLSKDIEAARTPVENFSRDQERLAKALREGTIDFGTHQRLHDNLREKYNLTDKSVLSVASSLSGPLAIGFGIVAAATTAAVASGVAFVSHLRDIQAELDETIKVATKLGLSFDELSSLRFAGSEIGGMEAASVDTAVRKMQINISKALEGDKEINAAFNKLGINAGTLLEKGPLEAVKRIADEFSKVTNQADRLNLATEIFGKGGADFVDTLSAGRDVIEESAAFQEKWNSLTDAQLVGIEVNNDAWGRIDHILDGITNKMAAEFAPLFLVAADNILGIADGVNEIDSSMRLLVDTTAVYLGQLKDIAELFVGIPKAFLGMNISDALDLTSGQDALDAVYAKRAQLEEQAGKKEEERRLAREKMIADERSKSELEAQEKLIERLSREIDDAAGERIRKEEKQRRDMQQKLAEDALKAADEHFKKERDNARKLRDDIAKGPQSIESGSAEAAKYMADQANAAIAAATVPDQALPTDEQLLQEAQRQSVLAEESAKREADMLAELKKLVDKKPDIKPIR